MSVRFNLDQAAEDILRFLGQYTEVERIMDLSTPDLVAAAYDTDRGGSIIWCDHHEREVAACHKAAAAIGEVPSCQGVPLPKMTDRTGDQAVATRVYDDQRTIDRIAAQMQRLGSELIGIAKRYQDSDLTPAVEKQLEQANRPKCERHLRYGYEREARSQSGTRVRRRDGSYVFTEAHKLCEWCEDVARDLGRLATEQEIHSHAQGKRLMRSA